MCRVVIRPDALRPPVLGKGRTSDFSGVDRVTSTKSATDEPRRPGVVGLCLRIPMSFDPYPLRAGLDGRTEDVDGAFAEVNDGTLGVHALAHPEAGALLLAFPVHRVDRGDLDVEDLLDGDLDLRLVRPPVHEEGVLALVEQVVAFLRNDRGDDDVVRVAAVSGGHFCSCSTSAAEAVSDLPAAGPATNCSRAAEVKTIWLLARTS